MIERCPLESSEKKLDKKTHTNSNVVILFLYVSGVDQPMRDPLQLPPFRQQSSAAGAVGPFYPQVPMQYYPRPPAGNWRFYRRCRLSSEPATLCPHVVSFWKYGFIQTVIAPLLLTDDNPFPPANPWLGPQVHHQVGGQSAAGMMLTFSLSVVCGISCSFNIALWHGDLLPSFLYLFCSVSVTSLKWLCSDLAAMKKNILNNLKWLFFAHLCPVVFSNRYMIGWRRLRHGDMRTMSSKTVSFNNGIALKSLNILNCNSNPRQSNNSLHASKLPC